MKLGQHVTKKKRITKKYEKSKCYKQISFKDNVFRRKKWRKVENWLLEVDIE